MNDPILTIMLLLLAYFFGLWALHKMIFLFFFGEANTEDSNE